MSSSQLLHLALFGITMILLSRRLPKFALAKPVTLGMILSAIVLFGVAALVGLPVELMPNVAYGNVTVFVDVRGGMPPPEVERLVTKPVEEAMGTVSHLRNLVSSSKKDRSVVTLEFDPGTDMDLAAMEVREKFLRVKSKLPPDIEKPIIARYEESDAPIVIAALTSDRLTPEDLRRMVDVDLKEKLIRVNGVANVEVGGGRERKIVVDIDRNKLAAAGLPMKKVVGVLESNNLNLRTGDVKADQSSLFGVRAVGTFQSVDEIRDMTLAVAKNGGRIRLKDVAEVKDSFLEQESYSRLNAKAAVTLYIQKETTANTVRVAEKVQEVLAAFKGRMPKGVDLVTISNQRGAILAAIDAVKITLVYGVALVILVLPLFLAKTPFTRGVTGALLALLVGTVVLFYLFHWDLNHTSTPVMLVCLGVLGLAAVRPDLRTAVVVAASIPVSVLSTLAFMYAEGISINVMSLSGLILGIGLLVDNAVVVIENYDRIVEEKPGASLDEAMLEAADEMTPSIIGGTLTTVVVFLPFSILAKQTQMLFAGISFAVTASLFSSLFVALTLVPALGARVDPRRFRLTAHDERAQGWAARFMVWWSGRRERLEKAARSTAGSVVSKADDGETHLFVPGLLALAAVMVGIFLLWIHAASMPAWNGVYLLAAVGLVGGGLWMVRYYESALRWVLGHRTAYFGGVAFLFCAAAGILVWSLPKDFMASSEQSEFVIFVELDTGVRLDISNRIVQEVEKTARDFADTKDAVKNVSSKIEGWSSKVYVTLKPLAERRLSTQDVINRLRPPVEKVVGKYGKEYKAFCYFSEPRSGKELFVELYGYEYDLMAKLAIELAGRMGKLPGLSDVKIRYRPGRPQITVSVDPVNAALFGLDVKEIAESLHGQMRGLRATTFYDKAQEVETVARLRPDQRETLEQMKELLFTSPSGVQVPLTQVGRIVGDLSPSEIWHRNRARMIQVSANLGQTSLEQAAASVKGALAGMSFPPEYYADIGGQYEDMVQANSDFWKAMVLTLFLVFMVMACQFESYLRPFVIMATVPLSSIGAVAALCFFNTTVTLGVSVGLLMLGGIEVNKGIMLIDRIEILRRRHPEAPFHDILVQAGLQRMRPIFMTTATTVLGLVPMALDRSESAVLWSPLAVTVIGGLISSTVLTLFVIPALFEVAEGLNPSVLLAPARRVFLRLSAFLPRPG